MTKKKMMLVLLVSVCIMLILSSYSSGNSVSDYKITNDSPEWKTMTTTEKKELLQLEQEQINLPTQELIKIVLENPYLTTMMSFNTIDQGLESLGKQFNGVKELYKRNDFLEVIAQEYTSLSQADNQDNHEGLLFLEAVLLSDTYSDKVDPNHYGAIFEAAKKIKEMDLSLNFIYPLESFEQYNTRKADITNIQALIQTTEPSTTQNSPLQCWE